jgi:hypothetical protein
MEEADWILAKLDELIEESSYALSTGVSADYSEYCGLVGKIRGYRESVNIVNDLKELIRKQQEL